MAFLENGTIAVSSEGGQKAVARSQHACVITRKALNNSSAAVFADYDNSVPIIPLS